jgi:predicted aconitase with swiveling domain
MSWRTFLGPVLIGTQKWGSARNTGQVTLSQSVDITGTSTTGTAFVLPAGAQIVSTQVIVPTTFNGTTPTVKLTIGATDITATAALGTAGVIAMTAAATAGGAALWKNVGASDATVTFTVGGTSVTTGAATVQIEYVMREVDGSQYPAQV